LWLISSFFWACSRLLIPMQLSLANKSMLRLWLLKGLLLLLLLLWWLELSWRENYRLLYLFLRIWLRECSLLLLLRIGGHLSLTYYLRVVYTWLTWLMLHELLLIVIRGVWRCHFHSINSIIILIFVLIQKGIVVCIHISI
jgi:hypothetical protein